MLRLKTSIVLVLLVLLAPLSIAKPDEVSGVVIRVIDGDTFDVKDFGTVRLADVDSPEIQRQAGKEAEAYARSYLLGNQVYLDVDDVSQVDNTGGNRYVCVVYLKAANGTLLNFNKMLVDSGHACVQDYPSNEFHPEDWWKGSIPSTACIEQTTGTPGSIVPGEKIPDGNVFVGSKKSDKYHIPSCRWAKRIKPENEIWFASAADARSKGYQPCGTCRPS
jgi:micrococcal nuclease